MNIRNRKEKKAVTYKGRPIPGFSMDTLKARKPGPMSCKTLKEHRYQSRLLYPAKLSIAIYGENKIVHDKVNFKQYIYKSALKKMLEEKLQPKEVN